VRAHSSFPKKKTTLDDRLRVRQEEGISFCILQKEERSKHGEDNSD
jgi:hypothetical protein